MLAEERENKCSKHLQVCKQNGQGILEVSCHDTNARPVLFSTCDVCIDWHISFDTQHEVENPLHLLYSDTMLTVKRNSPLHHAVKLNSAFDFITKSQAMMMSSINITFGTLVSIHISILKF